MSVILTLKERVSRAVFVEHSVVTLLLGMLALLLSSGFLISNTLNANYTLLTQFAPYNFWALMFVTYGLSKIFSVLYRTHFYIKVTTSLTGMWLWSYLMLSFVIFDKTPMAPTEMMMFLTGICEVWALTLILFDYQQSPRRRKTDDTTNRR